MRNDISLIHEKLNLLKEKQMVEQKVFVKMQDIFGTGE